MSIKDKIAKIRGMGHHVPVGLDDILEDMDKRIEALEPKKAEAKPEAKTDHSEAKSDEYKLTPTPVTLTKVEANPLDGTNLKS